MFLAEDYMRKKVPKYCSNCLKQGHEHSECKFEKIKGSDLAHKNEVNIQNTQHEQWIPKDQEGASEG